MGCWYQSQCLRHTIPVEGNANVYEYSVYYNTIISLIYKKYLGWKISIQMDGNDLVRRNDKVKITLQSSFMEKGNKKEEEKKKKHLPYGVRLSPFCFH